MIYLLRQLKTYLLTYKSMLLLGMLFVALSAVFKSFQGHYIRILTDALTRENEPATLHSILSNIFWMLLLSVVSGYFMFLMRQQIIVMSRFVEYDQKNDIFFHFLNLPHHFFISGRIGDLMNRIGEDVGKVRMFTGPAIMYLTNMIVTIITVLFFMISSSPELTFFVLIPLPFLSFFIYRITTKIHAYSKRSQEKLSDITSIVQESMNGIRAIRSASKERIFAEMLENHAAEYKKKNIQLARSEALFGPIVTLLISLTVLITVWQGSKLVSENKISSGNITEFIFYLYQLTWPFTAAGWVFSLIQRGKASQERIESVFLQEKQNHFGNGIPGSMNIRFNNVCLNFGFKNIFNGLNLELKENTITGLTGRTGSGKTTLVQLLAGMVEPAEGEILISGLSSKQIDRKYFHDHTSIVFQEPFLFSDTVLNNIIFGCKEEPPKEEVEEYTKICCIYDEIMVFPKQFQTLLGERGINLSGGQKQRIALARALIRKPKLLILDDCLSALDSLTASKILNYLYSLEHTTVLLISSRLSDLKGLKNILFLENGKISHQGNHEELLKNCGAYRMLWEIQNKPAD